MEGFFLLSPLDWGPTTNFCFHFPQQGPNFLFETLDHIPKNLLKSAKVLNTFSDGKTSLSQGLEAPPALDVYQQEQL